MRNTVIIFLLSVFFLSCFIYGFKSKQLSKEAKSKSEKHDTLTQSKLQLITTNSYEQTKLSNQFDLTVNFKRYSDSTDFRDSCILKIYIKDKTSKSTKDSISITSAFLFSFLFSNSDSMTSYVTKFHADRIIVDNYFGDVVVADFNFDGKDDIAVVCDSGGNGGPLYQFYIQTNGLRLVKDNFLTDTVCYFPDKIIASKKQMVTLVHAGACCVGEHVYQFDSQTNSWKQTSHKIIGR